MKKTISDSHTSSNKKIVFASNKKKSIPGTSNKHILHKVNTETGGLIKKVTFKFNLEKNKYKRKKDYI